MRIATWNIFGGRSLHRRTLSAEQLAASAAALGEFGPDVVALQEVWWNLPGGDADARLAAQLHLPFRYRAAALPGADDSQYGVVIASRVPAAQVRRLRLPRAWRRSLQVVGGRLRFIPDEPRVLLVARFTEPALTVATTHLSTKPWVAVRQLRVALRALDAATDEAPHLAGAAARVLLGDFNLPRPVVQAVLTCHRGYRLISAPPTYPADTPRSKIDHIVVSEQVQTSPGAALRSAMSDHRALVATISTL